MHAIEACLSTCAKAALHYAVMRSLFMSDRPVSYRKIAMDGVINVIQA